jgi:hypothetical protein
VVRLWEIARHPSPGIVERLCDVAHPPHTKCAGAGGLVSPTAKAPEGPQESESACASSALGRLGRGVCVTEKRIPMRRLRLTPMSSRA